MTISIGEVLTRAAQILWKHKVLWIFGILAGCSGSGTPSNSVSYSFSSGDVGTLPPGVENTINWLSLHPGLVFGLVAALFAIICLLVLFFIALSAFGRIGLITGTQRTDAGAERLTFWELVEAVKPYFWRIFGLDLLLGLVVFLVVLLFVLFFATFAAVTLGVGVLCLIPLICVLIPLAWLVAVIIEQAEIAIVIEDRSIPDGLARGWRVINANWGSMIVMALILILGTGLVSALLVVPFFVIAFPAIFAFALVGQNIQQTALILGLVCACIYLPVLLLANGIVQTYYHSAWTLTFLRATGRSPALPKAEGSLGPGPLEPLDV